MDKVAPPSLMNPGPDRCPAAGAVFAGARQRPQSRFGGLGIPIMLLACLFPIALAAQSPASSAEQVEAAYIYNFGKFILWPAAYNANRGPSFAICALDSDPLAPVLASVLSGNSLEGVPVVVHRLARLEDASVCRVLFIGGAEQGHLKEILAALGHAPVLTVSDIAGSSKHGVMIEFLLVNNHIRFDINRTTAEDAGLSLNSELLKVAVAVWEPGRTGGPR